MQLSVEIPDSENSKKIVLLLQKLNCTKKNMQVINLLKIKAVKKYFLIPHK